MLTQLITETLLGALTGYVTNHTAIRSLFQPGGVIEQTRDDFAREAGRLLEDQVLTQAVLARQLQQPEVQQVLAQALEDFLQKELPEALKGPSLAELPGQEERAAFLQELMVQVLRQQREQILLLLRKHLPWQQLWTEPQCQKLSEQLERVLSETLRQEQFAERLWHSWQAERGAESLEQLGLAPLCETIIANAAAISRQWPAWLQEQYGDELERLLLQTVQKLQLRPVLLELDQYMAEATVGQYLRYDAPALQAQLCAALQTDEGTALLEFVAEQLVAALEMVTAPVSQLLPADLSQRLTPLLQQQMPLLLEQLLDWLAENRSAVEAILESAVDEVAMETGGMKGMLLSQLKDSLLQQFFQQNDLAALLQPYLLQEQTSQQTAAALLEQLSRVMQERSLGDLVRRWNQKGQLQKLLQLLLRDNLQQALERSGLQLAEQLLAWKPGALGLAQRQQEIEQWLAGCLLRGLDKLDLAALLREQSQALQQIPVGQLLGMSEQQAAQWLAQMVRQGCGQLAKALPQASGKEVYEMLYDGLVQLVAQRGRQWIGQLCSRYTAQDLLSLAKPWLWQQRPQLIETLTKLGLDATRGRLSALAEEQIRQLSEAEMLKLVEDFMGRELQPLNYLGAGMGAVAGATVGTALSAALPVTAAANPALLLSVLAGKSAVFGAVGYGTNCAAVKGLFWPYAPVGGVELLQGVIPKQKARFAHSMGQLVDRYVINETVLRQLLQQSQPQWLAYSAELAADKRLTHLARGEAVAHRREMAQALQGWLERQGTSGCGPVLEKLGGMPLAFLCSAPLEEGRLERQGLPALERWLSRQLDAQVPLARIFSGRQLWQGLHAWLSHCPLPDLTLLCQKLLHSDATLRQLLSGQQLQKLQQRMQRRGEDCLSQKDRQAKLASWLAERLDGQQVKQWLARWVEQNLPGVFRLVEQAVLKLLQDRQESITAAVQQAILNRLGLMQQMGYSMMGGDELVARIVDRLLRQKLPIFLTIKRRELQAVCLRCWQQQIFPALLQLPIQRRQVEDGLQFLLAQPALHRGIGRIAAQTVEQAAALPVKTWGGWLQLDGLTERVQLQLGFQWQMHGAAALACWQPLAEELYRQQIGPLTLAQLTRGFQGEIPLRRLIQCQGLQPLLAALQLRLQENCAITRPQQWLCWPQMTAVLEQGLAALLADDHGRQWLAYAGEVLIVQLAGQGERLLPEDDRKVLLEAAAQAVFAVAQEYGVPLLQAMGLSQLAERQLIAMDSAHLETVVRGFASQYLVHIENRGWLGAAFALPGMLLYLL